MGGRGDVRFIKTTFLGYAKELVLDIFGERALIVAAHPDDESIGAGALMRYIESPFVVLLTDGAPRNSTDAAARGFASASAYAEARRRELLAALVLAGVPGERCLALNVPDQEASFRLGESALRLREIFIETAPESVLVPPYEGGHPDHDSAALAAHAASALLQREGRPSPALIEYASYHLLDGRLVSSEFLPRDGFEAITVILTEEDRRIKTVMLERFVTQNGMLRSFTVEKESFRPAPPYDFTLPPHQGSLYYESFDWGVREGARWRELAREALSGLGLEGAL